MLCVNIQRSVKEEDFKDFVIHVNMHRILLTVFLCIHRQQQQRVSVGIMKEGEITADHHDVVDGERTILDSCDGALLEEVDLSATAELAGYGEACQLWNVVGHRR